MSQVWPADLGKCRSCVAKFSRHDCENNSLRVFFVAFDGCCALKISRKEWHFQAITRGIRNFCRANCFSKMFHTRFLHTFCASPQKCGFPHFLALFLESVETPIFVQINVYAVRALRLDRKYITLLSWGVPSQSPRRTAVAALCCLSACDPCEVDS